MRFTALLVLIGGEKEAEDSVSDWSSSSYTIGCFRETVRLVTVKFCGVGEGLKSSDSAADVESVSTDTVAEKDSSASSEMVRILEEGVSRRTLATDEVGGACADVLVASLGAPANGPPLALRFADSGVVSA